MNDLKRGILDIDGFLLTPQTTVEDLEAFSGVKARKGVACNHFDFGGHSFISNGIEFEFYIALDKQVKKIEMYPQFPEIAAKYDLSDYSRDWLPYYQELRSIMDEWLEKQLGVPTRKNERNTSYDFPPILINTCSYIDERARDYRVLGGKVTIWYE